MPMPKRRTINVENPILEMEDAGLGYGVIFIFTTAKYVIRVRLHDMWPARIASFLWKWFRRERKSETERLHLVECALKGEVQ